jgi:hypothetical protein
VPATSGKVAIAGRAARSPDYPGRVERWRQYWSAPDGRIAVAVLRVAIAGSLLWTLARIAEHAATAHSALYYPHGIWLAFPGRPGPALLAAIAVVAWGSTTAFALGAATRVAHAVSLVSVLALATHEVSSLPTWTHQNVPPLLASIAFLGARGGDALSIDALVRWWRGRSARDVPGAYGWTVRLLQLAVASVFFVAACCKLSHGGPGLAWALSDNLRHQLLMRFDWIHLPRTAAADWIMAEPWRYQAFALANLGSQLAPIAAAFAMHRPVLRAALGLVWIGEVIGLGVVMALWDTHWLPLAAAFVDWDRLVGAPRSEPAAAPRGRRVFVATLLAFAALQAFVLNQRLNLYPFSSYPMFAEVRARWPYSWHQSYDLAGGRVEVVGQRPLTDDEQRWVDRRIVYRWIWRERDPEALRRKLAGVLDEVRRRFPSAGVATVRIWLTVDRAPAYPAPARLDHFDLAITGELDTAGRFHTALGRLDGDHLTCAPRGLDLGLGLGLGDAALIAYRDGTPEPEPLAAARDATGFALAAPLPDDAVDLAVLIDGRPWLVADRARPDP